MGTLRTKTIEPATGTTLTLGASGDSITVNSDSIKTNTFKDAGGNTLFTSDGAGTLSSVNSSIGAAGPVLISTHTVIRSAPVTSVSITGLDSGDYDEYMFVITNYEPSTDGEHLTFQCSTDGGSTYTVSTTNSNFEVNQSHGGTTNGPNSNTYDEANASTRISLNVGTGSNQGDECSSSVLNLFNPSSTTYVKHYYARTQAHQDNDYAVDMYCAGYFNTTSAVDAINFGPNSGGNVENVTIQMYGIA